MIEYRIKDGFHIILPEYEEPVPIRWSNGVPFGGHSQKEYYFERMIEYDSANEVCPQCDGIGKIDILDQSKINPTTISPPYKSVTCESCNGIGYIEDEN